MIDRECFTQARYSCLEPSHSVGKEPVGELSLSGGPECLSLQDRILTDVAKTGKGREQRYPCAHAQDKLANRPPLVFPTFPLRTGGHSSPWLKPGASLPFSGEFPVSPIVIYQFY
jgi:hypothetical protein